MLAFQGAIAQGVLWGIMVLGVYITFRLLEISDLTVDGSFALGGCVCAVMVINYELDPVLALLVSIVAGLVAGAVTGILHTVFEIPAILSGILTQISLWSINLRIMGRKSNIGFARETETIFTKFVALTGMSQSQASVVIGLAIAVVLVMLLYWFFGTELGSSLRATGNNEDMIRALGVDTKKMKVIAFMLSNGLVALSGGLITQSQRYGDIGMGTGAIVIGLAAIVIGEVLFAWAKSFIHKLFAAVIGAVVYFIIRVTVLQLPPPFRMDSNDMKLISAIIVALALCIPVAMAKWRIAKSYTEDGGDE